MKRYSLYSDGEIRPDKAGDWVRWEELVVKIKQETCDQCEEYQEDMKLCIDPYLEEIREEQEIKMMCSRCYRSSLEDI